ncbi:GntR family transcriptional regulator [Streptomyces anulatus]|uniref:GntR family transcriptional regulator n=1 Tax=Streptomyces anulatus TaxID=1892 RepID=UPI001EF2828F|nr:GntR family transcriptional regulator [Streptomyces anulatus]
MSGNQRPRYSPERVSADLRERIADGRWPPGRVLTYADIQQVYGVSRETVATALARLREAGLVETRRMGTRPKVVGESWRSATGTSIQDDITQHVREQVAKGVYRPGDRIPPLAALAAEYAVSVATARRAIRPLLHEGILITIRPRGTFVASRGAPGPSEAA